MEHCSRCHNPSSERGESDYYRHLQSLDTLLLGCIEYLGTPGLAWQAILLPRIHFHYDQHNNPSFSSLARTLGHSQLFLAVCYGHVEAIAQDFSHPKIRPPHTHACTNMSIVYIHMNQWHSYMYVQAQEGTC